MHQYQAQCCDAASEVSSQRHRPFTSRLANKAQSEIGSAVVGTIGAHLGAMRSSTCIQTVQRSSSG